MELGKKKDLEIRRRLKTTIILQKDLFTTPLCSFCAPTFFFVPKNSLLWHFNGRFKHCSHQGLCANFFMYPLSLYLSKHAWGRREDLEVLSYTHIH